MCKCGKTFNDKTGTIFYYSRLSLRAYSQNNPIFTPPEKINSLLIYFVLVGLGFIFTVFPTVVGCCLIF
jgi:hypothetical protein